MSEGRKLDRRGFLARGLAAASAALLGGCEELSNQDWVKRILYSGETLTYAAQRALITPHVANPDVTLMRDLAELAGEQVRRLVAGEPLLSPVDPDAGY